MKTLEQLDCYNTYLEIDISNEGQYEPSSRELWRNMEYAALITHGNTIDELIANARIWTCDEHGADFGPYQVQSYERNWISSLIQQEYLKLLIANKQ